MGEVVAHKAKALVVVQWEIDDGVFVCDYLYLYAVFGCNAMCVLGDGDVMFICLYVVVLFYTSSYCG